MIQPDSFGVVGFWRGKCSCLIGLICALKNGWLGAGSLLILNKALFGKSLWRFSMERDRLLRKFFPSYGKEKGGLC